MRPSLARLTTATFPSNFADRGPHSCDAFLLGDAGLTRVTHPLICTVSGHRVAFVERRGSYREHRCVDCGHTFGWTA